MAKFVRLYPRNPQLGYVLRSYTIQDPQPLRFLESRGWYEVDDKVAKVLKDIPQESRYPQTRAFMIADSKEEAKEMDDRVQKQILKARRDDPVGTPDAPVSTTRPGSKKPAEKPRATEAASDDGEEEAPAPKPRTRKKKA